MSLIKHGFGGAKAVLYVLASAYLWLYALSAEALPSFARQTGEACTACHVQAYGVGLTPRGRTFKLKGYTDGETNLLTSLSLVVNGGGVLDVTDNKDRFFGGDASASFFRGSVFYAGKLYDHVGAYVQGTYLLDPDTGRDTGYLDKVDIRFANQVDLAGQHVDYGISVNNEPGVQDLWNTNAVWGGAVLSYSAFPYGFNLVPLADRGLSGHVGGASLYAMINNLLYVEAGGYASLARDVQKGIGRDNNGFNTQIDGGAAYWRIALQHEWDGHYLSLGHFGLRADTTTNPYNPFRFFSSDASYSDLGLDATYQYLADPNHIFEFNGRYIRETQTSFRTEGNTTESFNVKGTYTWQQTLALSIGYSRYAYPKPFNRYIEAQEFFMTGLSYSPFGKKSSLAEPWLNLRLNLVYVSDITSERFLIRPGDSLYLTGSLAF